MTERLCFSCTHRIGHYDDFFSCAVHLAFKEQGIPYECAEHSPRAALPEKARSGAPPQAALPPATNRGGKFFWMKLNKGEEAA